MKLIVGKVQVSTSVTEFDVGINSPLLFLIALVLTDQGVVEHVSA